MSSNWRTLIKAKRAKTVHRIILTVRGKQIVKDYTDEEDFRRWKLAYQKQVKNGSVEAMNAFTIYE